MPKCVTATGLWQIYDPMNLLHRYLFRQILITLAFTCFAVTIVVLFTQSFRLLSLVIDNSASLFIFLQLALLTIPTFFGIILPIGLAIAIVFVYQRLAGDSELVIMRTAGLSATDLAKPALLMGIGATIFGLVLTFWIAPWANRELVSMQYKIRNEFSIYLLRPGVFNDIPKGPTFYARRRDRQGGLENILIHDNRKPDLPVTIMADRGQVATIEGEPRVIVYHGQRQEYDRAKHRLSILDFEQYSLSLALLSGANDRLPDPRELSVEDLLGGTTAIKNSAGPDRLRAELHQRICTAGAGVGFALLAAAILLGGQFNRRGMGGRVILAAVTLVLFQAMVMWVSNLVARNIGFAPLLYMLITVPLPVAWLLLRHNPVAPAFNFGRWRRA